MKLAPRYANRRLHICMADLFEIQATVEATLEGRHLYEQRGFVMQEYFTLAVAERWANRPKARLFFMHRPKRVV